MIALNDVAQTGIGFETDINALTVYWHGGEKVIDLGPKFQVAFKLLKIISENYEKN